MASSYLHILLLSTSQSAPATEKHPILPSGLCFDVLPMPPRTKRLVFTLPGQSCISGLLIQATDRPSKRKLAWIRPPPWENPACGSEEVLDEPLGEEWRPPGIMLAPGPWLGSLLRRPSLQALVFLSVWVHQQGPPPPAPLSSQRPLCP